MTVCHYEISPNNLHNSSKNELIKQEEFSSNNQLHAFQFSSN